ncbi:MAG: TlpA family protein disulfide reductase, partial [Prolixibacteraceae bacterium]|nr:TlpA family protein disulfide reductase [Prolixibacteraceae bacterium]
LAESTNTVQEEFVKNNPASYVVPVFLSSLQYEKTTEEMDSILNNLDPKLEKSSIIQMLKERVEAKKKVKVGKNAPDFTQNDPDGNPITFSDIYSANEYTLLDFWAAWCGPCRGENPNVVAVYNEFKDKGFTVFGVSLDRTKEDWLKAIEADGLTWTHVSDLGYWDSEVPKLYAVYSIPSNFLVDKEGKIIATGLRGEDLRAKISELLD